MYKDELLSQSPCKKQTGLTQPSPLILFKKYLWFANTLLYVQRHISAPFLPSTWEGKKKSNPHKRDSLIVNQIQIQDILKHKIHFLFILYFLLPISS